MKQAQQDCQGGGGYVSLNLREASRAEDSVGFVNRKVLLLKSPHTLG